MWPQDIHKLNDADLQFLFWFFISRQLKEPCDLDFVLALKPIAIAKYWFGISFREGGGVYVIRSYLIIF